ncbi:MAG TPA: PPOX class F420-dependent oxidoreductase [Terriglobales bacterium]|jgi:PPOX class probable F420-dependent enzyme|nr:PPOX class F420-dependent oxidoreductase [Terriglobales bacterium]
MAIPRELAGQKYMSLATFRKSGVAVYTPVWFGEDDGKLYVTCRADSGKCKRLRNSSKARIAPSTLRGKITGPEFAATAKILPKEEWPRALASIRKKYWITRFPWPWRKSSVYLEIEMA